MNRLKQGLFRTLIAVGSSFKPTPTRNISSLLWNPAPLLSPNGTKLMQHSTALMSSKRSFVSTQSGINVLSSSPRNTSALLSASVPFLNSIRNVAEHTKLYRMHIKGPKPPRKKKRQPLDGKPQAKGVVLKTLIKKPKKPNSANRKCVLVRLSTGKEMTAYVPGEGHNLTEHNIVLVRVGRLKDVPGVKIKCIRGKFDLPKVIKKTS